MIWTRLKVFTLMGNWFCDVLDRVSSSLYYVYDQGKGTPGVISGIYKIKALLLIFILDLY